MIVYKNPSHGRWHIVENGRYRCTGNIYPMTGETYSANPETMTPKDLAAICQSCLNKPSNAVFVGRKVQQQTYLQRRRCPLHADIVLHYSRNTRNWYCSRCQDTYIEDEAGDLKREPSKRRREMHQP